MFVNHGVQYRGQGDRLSAVPVKNNDIFIAGDLHFHIKEVILPGKNRNFDQEMGNGEHLCRRDAGLSAG